MPIPLEHHRVPPVRRIAPPFRHAPEGASALRASIAPPQAGRDVAEGEIPEAEGLLLAGNSFEIIQNFLSQEFNQRQMPVSDKKMSIHFKQRLL